ncbi:hypothetical protein ACWCPS_36125 [Streptomyces mauvecolor]
MDNERLVAVKERVQQAWEFRRQHRSVRSYLTGWHTSRTPDGAPMLSARVEGFDRSTALQGFVTDGIILAPGHSQGPVFDYSSPGRIQCEWRDGGVWVQLWHPDTTLPTPAVLAAFPKPQRPMAVAVTPSGRLRFRRNKKHTV